MQETKTRYQVTNTIDNIPSVPDQTVLNKNQLTDQSISEEELKKYGEYYYFLFENNPFPAWIYDPETWRFLDVNKAAIEFYGYTKVEFLSMTLADIRRADDLPALKEQLEKVKKKQPSAERIWRHLKKNGQTVFVKMKTNNFLYNARPSRLVMITDMTASVDTEALLIETNEQYRLANERYEMVTDATRFMIWDWNLKTNELYRDPKGLLLVYGMSNERDIRHINGWLDRIHPEDLSQLQKIIFNLLNSGDQNIFDARYRFKREDGNYVFIYDRGYILKDARGKPYRVVGAAQDITDQKKSERTLMDKQKAIGQATIYSQEKEITEVSRELHDNVNQLLTTTKLYLDTALVTPNLKDELITKSSKNISEAIKLIRTVSQSLMNPSLKDLGLLESIKDLIENLGARAIKIDFLHKHFNDHKLDESQKLVLFRAVQEGMKNILKHSHATRATLTISNEGDLVRLTLTDNGKGFDDALSRKEGGLINIRNRLYLVNGNLTVISQPGKGCTLVVELPRHLINHF